METPRIIQLSDFADHIDFAINLLSAKLNPQINKAQDFDLCNLMGNSFYFDFMSSFNADGTQKTDASQQYKDLYNGSVYGANIIQPGLKYVVVFFTGARLIKNLDLHVTPNGMMIKRNDFSDHADSKLIGNTVTEYENQALAYWNKCAGFINTSGKTLFPLYEGFTSCGSGRQVSSRQRIAGITGSGYPKSYYYGR